jgi:hypothetical protein
MHLKGAVCRRTLISIHRDLQRRPRSNRHHYCTGGSRQARRAPWRQCAARPHTCGPPPLDCRRPTLRGGALANTDHVTVVLRRCLLSIEAPVTFSFKPIPEDRKDGVVKGKRLLRVTYRKVEVMNHAAHREPPFRIPPTALGWALVVLSDARICRDVAVRSPMTKSLGSRWTPGKEWSSRGEHESSDAREVPAVIARAVRRTEQAASERRGEGEPVLERRSAPSHPRLLSL